MFENFLNPAHHKTGVPLDFISYHFYAEPTAEQTIEDWQYTFFDQAEGFLNTVRFAEQIRKRFSPYTKTDLNELGVILPEDEKEIHQPGYAPDRSRRATGISRVLCSRISYVETAKLGIDVVGESQLVGYRITVSQCKHDELCDPRTKSSLLGAEAIEGQLRPWGQTLTDVKFQRNLFGAGV